MFHIPIYKYKHNKVSKKKKNIYIYINKHNKYQLIITIIIEFQKIRQKYTLCPVLLKRVCCIQYNLLQISLRLPWLLSGVCDVLLY